ncbi:hypothetical protein [Marinilabilia rubra]|uniref:Uncharacterized protein n=1 Tax=Marinilabilia rubra TaxID=2162893 RepID=A0A2U2B406_9BACT|nr:hypothetical protein [Marinilabilia rubra]PWD97802.1 hypothetical protein DDZ16_18975 [Marinilabilia rubra]
MVRTVYFIIILLSITFGSLKGQSKEFQKLQDVWNRFINADDNEKDFRSVSFLNYLEQELQHNEAFIDHLEELPEWQRIDTNGGFSLLAAYVSFEYRPDRIYYCLCSTANGNARALVKESTIDIDQEHAQIVLNNMDVTDSDIASVEIKHGKELLFNIPDIKTALLVRRLSEQRGGKVAFEVSDSLENRVSALLSNSELFGNDFSGLEGLSTLISSDQRVKIVTWNVEERMGEHFFYGVLAVKNEDGGMVNVFQLKDRRKDISTPEYAVLNTSKWFGAVYYQMVSQKYKGDMYYTLLGHNGNDAFSKLRIVDVLSFSKRGTPKFGGSIFEINGRTKRRLVYEYSNQANMMLRFDEREELIVLDHLAPMEPMYEGDRSYYGPDFSYDALEFKKGKWVLIENVELRNR